MIADLDTPEINRLADRITALKADKETAYAHLRECQRERIGAVNGRLGACPGICWTNEERAEDAALEADERLVEAMNAYWAAIDEARYAA